MQMQKNNYYRFVCSKEFGLPKLKLKEHILIDKRFPELFHQLTKVLRLKVSEQIVLIKENSESPINFQYIFSVIAINKQSITVELIKKQKIKDVLDIELGLALALPNKPGKLENILKQCTELGTTQFYLFKSDFSNFSHQLNQQRLMKIITEAVEQSERARVPQIHLYTNIDAYLEDLQRTCLVAMERELCEENLLNMMIDHGVDILIGPEGGFSDREKALIQSYQLRTFSLGKQILRNETSAIVATGILSLKMQSF